MRLDIASALLLQSAATASFFDALFVESDVTSASRPSATSETLNNAFAAPRPELIESHAAAIQTQRAALLLQNPIVARPFHPNPHLNPAFDNDNALLLAREVVTQVAQGAPATASAVGPTQVPAVTTMWPETVLPNGEKTWIPVTYSQSFAEVPQQLPSPGVGTIGYGNEGSGDVGGDKVVRNGAAVGKAAVSVSVGVICGTLTGVVLLLV